MYTFLNKKCQSVATPLFRTQPMTKNLKTKSYASYPPAECDSNGRIRDYVLYCSKPKQFVVNPKRPINLYRFS